jgi:4-hydroxybenzoate polyprenyltransferase
MGFIFEPPRFCTNFFYFFFICPFFVSFEAQIRLFMPNPVKNLFDFLLYGNLLIASAAVCQAVRNLTYLHGSLADASALLIAIGAGTWCMYSLLRVFKLKNGTLQSHISTAAPSQRAMILTLHKKDLYVIIGITSVVGIISIFYLTWPTIAALAVVALASLCYGWLGSSQPLRAWPYLKSFLVPMVWVAATVWLPAIELRKPFDFYLFWLSLERFCFIFAITLPFDLRDAATDTAAGIRTLPNQLGAKRTTILSFIALGIGLCSAIAGAFEQSSDGLMTAIGIPIATLCTYLLASGLIWHVRKPRHAYYYYGALDALLIVELLF